MKRAVVSVAPQQRLPAKGPWLTVLGKDRSILSCLPKSHRGGLSLTGDAHKQETGAREPAAI